ncbi:MAG: integrase family protein [Candidatus Sedimenticola sp. (ex Thyasira tokunagai)]
MGKLNDRKIQNAKPSDKDQWLNDGDGLYLRIRKSGSKTWIIRRKRQGKTEIITLGDIDSLSLKEARHKATGYQLKTNVSGVKVKNLVDKYMAEVVEIKHRRPELVWGYMQRAVLPLLGKKKVRDITTSDLVQIIQEYKLRGSRTADQLRSNLKALFGYAVELGYIANNPAFAITSRITGYVQVGRDRVLTDDEIRLLWAESHQNSRILRFLLLTSLRISEARKGIRENDKWLVAKNISKNKEEHWVYLTKLAKEQFPLPTCTATNIQAWLKRWCKRNSIEPAFTPHDLRRTASTQMSSNGVEPFIVERALNHKLQGVMGIYNQAEYENERIEAAIVLEKAILEIVGNDKYICMGTVNNG